MKINQMISTPNGPGRYVSTYRLPSDDVFDMATGILVKHTKDQVFDKTKCAEIIAMAPHSGPLVVYRKEECSDLST